MTMKIPLYEDTRALAGFIIAATGLFIAQMSSNAFYDGPASIGIGLLLNTIAFQLGTDSRGSL